MWRWVTLENFRFEPCCSLPSPAICAANVGVKCVRLLLDVPRCSWLWEQHTELWPNSVTWCVPKQSPHHRAASHTFEGWNSFRAAHRFYLLGSACWSLLRFWNAFDHLHIFSFGALSPVAPEMNQLLHVVKKKNQKCTFLFPFAYLRDSTDELSAKPESCAWLILKCQGIMEMSVFALFFSDTVL